MKHAELVAVCQKWLRDSRKHAIVLAEAKTMVSNEEPDVIGWRGWASTLIECKVSRADFLRDKAKSFRKDSASGMGRERWYAAPVGMLRIEDLPERWGLLEVEKKVRIVRPATAFLEWQWRQEMALMTSALRRATEGWGQKMFGDVAQTDKKHPRIERREARLRAPSDAKAAFNEAFPKIPRRDGTP